MEWDRIEGRLWRYIIKQVISLSNLNLIQLQSSGNGIEYMPGNYPTEGPRAGLFPGEKKSLIPWGSQEAT